MRYDTGLQPLFNTQPMAVLIIVCTWTKGGGLKPYEVAADNCGSYRGVLPNAIRCYSVDNHPAGSGLGRTIR